VGLDAGGIGGLLVVVGWIDFTYSLADSHSHRHATSTVMLNCDHYSPPLWYHDIRSYSPDKGPHFILSIPYASGRLGRRLLRFVLPINDCR
jgi:hypothetical protein